MRVSCVADYFIKAESVADVLDGIQLSKKSSAPYLIVGRGSNIILPSFYKGVIIFLAMSDFGIFREGEKIKVNAEAGVYLPFLSYEISKHEATGMEWAGGVPGSIGGAVRGNAGAFGDFIGDYIKKVKTINLESGKEEEFYKEKCDFEYRGSFFKKNKNNLITEAEMILPLKKDEEDKFNKYLIYRRDNHPSDPSAGSIFKNPKIDEGLTSNSPEVAEKFKEKGSVPAGFLIEECGLKGESCGGAEISLKHANFIVNKGGASGEDVVSLIELVKKRVKENFNIDMVEEVEVISAI